jgi:hypothetical protein
VPFEVVGEITETRTIAVGRGIRELRRLRSKTTVPVDGRKMKGVARVRLPDSTIAYAEVHWYEGHGIGRGEPEIKRFLSKEP